MQYIVHHKCSPRYLIENISDLESKDKKLNQIISINLSFSWSILLVWPNVQLYITLITTDL